MEYCGSCNQGLVKKDGKFVECKCVTRARIKQYLAPFLQAPKVNTAIVKGTDLLIAAKSRRIYVPKLKGNFYKTIIAHYLAASGLYNSYTLIHTYEIIDLYLGNIEDSSIYDFNTKVIVILHGFCGVPNKRELDILQEFMNIHEDKIILFYSNSSNQTELKTILTNFKSYSNDSGREQ